jgi:methyltransferase (TIGR00027 family)
MLVAACRMLASELPPQEQLIADPLAHLFVDERAIEAARADPDLQLGIRMRTRYIDDAIKTFVAAHTDAQVLLLGAGLDARAYRLTVDAPFFEVDFPDTLSYKAAAAQRAGLAEPPRRVAVPVDMASEAVASPLLAAGFDSRRPSVVVWEGVINYLRNEEAEAVVQQLSDLLSPGSWLVADYVEISWFRGSFENSTKTISSNLSDGGEPLRSGLKDVKATLDSAGFEVLDDEVVELLPPRYGLALRPRKYPARIFTAVRTSG